MRAVTPGPNALLSAGAAATMIRNALPAYVWLNSKYGDAVRCPVAPRHTLYLFARPEHAEHVLAVNQDNYVKAFTYRPLRAMIGDGLLTAEGEHWRRHRRLLQPMFSRRDVVRETLRLYPPAWTVERDALAADLVAGVPVPAGSTVAISPYLIHRNPDVWPDPAGFDPGRFLDGEPDRYTWIPFGGGRRACIGQAFAEQEAVLSLASIAQRYRLELPASGLPAAIGGVTLRPAHGLSMRLRRRAH